MDTWERYNDSGGDMNKDIGINEIDNGEEIKENDTNGHVNKYSGVIGSIQTVFDELIDFKNAIESELNNEIMQEQKNILIATPG